ncbi:MAG: choice-of-anchor L domain-containing protein [Ferruginibacter sp.]
MNIFTKSILFLILFFAAFSSSAQLIIKAAPDGLALAQKLVGDGVTITNVSFTGNMAMTGFFSNNSGTQINIDSGIVLTNGRAKGGISSIGVNGNGFTAASNILANTDWALPGDADLDNITGSTHDACVLEFDFIPLGDSIKFNYVFSSEEYTPAYVCDFNDAFAFFISGPGITGLQNIALIPGTFTPVTIFNVNNVEGGACPNNQAYFVDNINNTFFTHDGHTTVLTALEKVQPCQTYHLKLVIADVSDGEFDSGVFLEAKSLSSNVFKLDPNTKVDATGNNFLAEGCQKGVLKITRPYATIFSQTINLDYQGTAVNGVDVQTLPATVTIPANQTEINLDIIPLVDNIAEGTETLIINILPPCGGTIPTTSTTIQIRDYDILDITPDTSVTCKNSAVQLFASAGYNTYTWDTNPTLSNTSISNPFAMPASQQMYYCTATLGNCFARDSAFVKLKTLQLSSQKNVNCKNGSTGAIKVTVDQNWTQPIQFSINGAAFQSDSSFNNLPVGTYTIRVKDATCLDSISVNIIQAFSDLLESSTHSDASCSGNADGNITITANGGNSPYSYSINNGTVFQTANSFPVKQGSYPVLVKDGNGCTKSETVIVNLNNSVVVDAGSDKIICEGKSVQLTAVSNADSYSWSPANTLTGANSIDPIAAPVANAKYYVVATKGICTKKDSLIVNVNPAPKADAGRDAGICFGADAQLSGSGGIQYFWSPASNLNNPGIANPAVVRPLQTIAYYLKVKDSKGCESILYDTVKVIVTPAIKLFAGNDTIAAINQPLQLHVIEIGSSNVTNYEWSPAYGLNNAFTKSPVATLNRDITYYVTGTTALHCEGSDTINIKVYKGPEIYVPNAFTPNSDGRNDLLKPIAIGMTQYHYFRVYNRWGKIVFSTADFNKGWDGKINGILQNTGSYVWIAEAVDYKGNIIQRKGVSTIIR